MSGNITEEMKKLVRSGKEEGFILISELDKIIEDLGAADQQYIRDGLEELKIQIVKTSKDYDEYKYMTGEKQYNFYKVLVMEKQKHLLKMKKINKNS